MNSRSACALGMLAMPLAFVALPLYVQLPHWYAQFGLSLPLLGAVLLCTRLLDAWVDPYLGRLADGALQSKHVRLWVVGAMSAMSLAFAALVNPALWLKAQAIGFQTYATLAILLVVVYWAYSFLTVLQQSYASQLGRSEVERSRLVAWREGFAMAGVLLASALPAVWPLGALALVLPAGLALGAWALLRVINGSRGLTTPAQTWLQPSQQTANTTAPQHTVFLPWRNASFRSLLLVFVLNGVASAVPATLLLFFAQDRLGAGKDQQAMFLLLYFVAGALSLPLWLRVGKRMGLVRSWGLGLVLSVLVFVSTVGLHTGDIAAFALICALSGACLGVDLIAPAALLAALLQRETPGIGRGSVNPHAGLYLGWWHLFAKLNLALAAGLALPALAVLGYSPQNPSATGLTALSWTYAGLPCAFKLLAVCALWRFSKNPHVNGYGEEHV